MTYFHLGPWAYDNGHYASIEPDLLRVPAETWVVDLTDPVTDE